MLCTIRDCVRCNVEMEHEKTEHPANENQLANERVRGRDRERERETKRESEKRNGQSENIVQ